MKLDSLKNAGESKKAMECVEACAPSADGCKRCQAVPAGKVPANASAILFGPRDKNAGATLAMALSRTAFQVIQFGPLLLVPNVRERLGELGALLKSDLSAYTLSCIQAAYAPSGVETMEQALGAMVFSSPLPDMLESIEHQWIRAALSENWLFSVFHPIVNAANGSVYGHEALLRAKNPNDGKIIGAGQIIQASEKLNLLHQLDQRARQAAIGGAARHIPGSSRIFINFLPNTIYDPEICLRTTMEAAAENNLSMARLVFEVVETQQIPDMAALMKILDYYRARGVGTAIDDMGAGFTGVNYITSLKPDFVKLDREFVLAAEQDDAGRRSMDVIIRTSHAHGARVIAEGIETTAQMSMCANAGVDFFQGFLFAKPACPPQGVNFPVSKREAA